MQTSTEIRQAFLDFFEKKGHKIVPSAPVVVKNDPTLLFINSGMAPFKDIFLGNQPIQYPRIADTQKCLRVSGKHNDLEEVGVDTYHHTLFEMLGNWSFGDYFKKEAIAWAWELLTEVYKLDKSRLYVTVFEGDQKESLAFDQEAYDEWKKYIAEERIINGNKKDNFWEMGDTGPCGPCSEIHVDLRSDAERAQISGKDLVNNDHPQVIEIWNNVFMEFERKADGSLIKLAKQHVDTGMGFERLVRAIQNKTSNYDTDIFLDTIEFISKKSGIPYTFTQPASLHSIRAEERTDIAMRVIADHIRTIAFTIADGQLPSNNGAGYVIRRILRRAIRYGYSYLNFQDPFLVDLVPVIAQKFATVFPELMAQKDFVSKVIQEEEISFLRTLSQGIKRFEAMEEEISKTQIVPGKIAFELNDTFGFPIDLTKLIAAEKGYTVDEKGFDKEMNLQKDRSRDAAASEKSDWILVGADTPSFFVGYDEFETETTLIKYRKVTAKDNEIYQLVLAKTPFYAESGGQVGDSGLLLFGEEKISIFDTKKENDLIIHFAKNLPSNPAAKVQAKIDLSQRNSTIKNHSATHLLQAALRQVLGTHVQQKGSLVNAANLRFDFAHFAKMTAEEIKQVEQIVNQKIMENISLDEKRNIPFQQAIEGGVMALFGEKYGEFVRVITFDKNYSSELCGGCHVPATGAIGFFKIIAESSTAAGVRRIEAVTGQHAIDWAENNLTQLEKIKASLNNPKDIFKAIDQLKMENENFKKQLAEYEDKQISIVKREILDKVEMKAGKQFYASTSVAISTADSLRKLGMQLTQELKDNFVLILAASIENKNLIHVRISKSLNENANQILKDLAPTIKGGGPADFVQASAESMTEIEKFIEKLKNKSGFLC